MIARASISVIALVMLIQGVPVAVVGAQNRSIEKAEEHYRIGIELVKEEQFGQAAVEFRRAYKMSKDYRKLYNLGTTYMVLGDSVKAVETYQLYLKEGGAKIPAERRNEVENHIAQHRQRIAYLNIHVNVHGSQILVDQEKIGVSPLRNKVAVTTGDHIVTVRNDGYQEEERKITVASRDQRDLYFTLIKISARNPLISGENGQLEIECAIPDVQVLISDQISGTTPMKTPILVSVGEHEISFEREGYTTDIHVTKIDRGDVETIKCDIQPLDSLHSSQISTLRLDLSEDGAIAYVDGNIYDTDDGKRLPAGRHHIEVKRSGFSPWTEMVDLKPGESLTLNVDLIPLDDYRSEYKSRANTIRTWAIILGVAGITTGVVALGLHIKNDNDFDAYQKEYNRINLETSQQLTPTLQEELLIRQEKNNNKLHDIHDMDAIIVGLAIGGSALFLTGLIVFMVGDDPGKYEGIVAAVTGNGARVEWSSTF